MRGVIYALITFSLLTFTIALTQQAYDEDLAVNLTLLSGSAYCEIQGILKKFDLQDPNLQFRTVGKNLRAMTYDYYDHIHNYADVFKNDFTMIAYANHPKQHFVLAFEGTHGTIQLIQELIQSENIPYDLHEVPDAYVLEYFLTNYKSTFRENFLKILKNITQSYPGYKIIYTGHSMGGAFATLAALDGRLSNITDSSVLVYTFGQPRIGNYEFRQAVDASIPNLYRVVHNQDMVAHLPPCNYIFGCEKSYGGRAYYHTNTEVWYPGEEMKRGEYKVCVDEDEACANSITLFDASKGEHMFYFGIRINCKQGSAFPNSEMFLIENDLFTVEQLLSH